MYVETGCYKNFVMDAASQIVWCLSRLEEVGHINWIVAFDTFMIELNVCGLNLA